MNTGSRRNIDCDKMTRSVRLHVADWSERGKAGGKGLAQEIVDKVWVDADKKATAGLGVADKCAGETLGDADELAVAVPVAGGAAGYAALLKIVGEGIGVNEGEVCKPDVGAGARGCAHLTKVACKAKTRDIGHGVHIRQGGKVAAGSVEADHTISCQGGMLTEQFFVLLGGGEHAYPQGFGQEKKVSRAGPAIGLEAGNRNSASDGQAEYGLRAVDTVAACEGNASLGAGITPSLYHFAGDLCRQGVDWPAKDGNGHQGGAAHGVDVADCVDSSNAAKIEGVIDNGHEKICSADDGTAIT